MAQHPIRRNEGSRSIVRGHHPLDLFRLRMDSLFNRSFGRGWLTPFDEDFVQTRGRRSRTWEQRVRPLA